MQRGGGGSSQMMLVIVVCVCLSRGRLRQATFYLLADERLFPGVWILCFGVGWDGPVADDEHDWCLRGRNTLP